MPTSFTERFSMSVSWLEVMFGGPTKLHDKCQKILLKSKYSKYGTNIYAITVNFVKDLYLHCLEIIDPLRNM